MNTPKKIVICGAGIAGIAAAYYLTQANQNLDLTLIDKNQPLSYTSSKSGENFRDYWPHKSMEALSSHSIELMKALKTEHGEDAFRMEFSGYHFVSHNAQKPIFADDNSAAFRQRNKVDTNPTSIQHHYPYLDAGIQKSIFIQKAGNVDSISMANLMLQVAKDKGLKLIESTINGLKKWGNGFTVNLANNEIIHADQIILATGPFLNHLAKNLDLKFPVWNTLQRKFIIPDPKGIIPTDMPFTIYADGQTLDWSAEERAFMQAESHLKWMTEPFPGAIHIKPESGRIKMGWAFSKKVEQPKWDIPIAEYFPQVVLKGASRFIPALAAYAENIPTPIIEYGGYYTRTEENWPLIGATKVDNVYVIGALAGFGTMTASAAGELCAQTLLGKALPWYADYFSPNRYTNPTIQAEMDQLDTDGQL